MNDGALHVAIDCRKAADLGIGRYITGLTHALVKIAPHVRFTLLAQRDSASLLPQEGVAIRITDIGHYRPHEPHMIGRIIEDIGPDVFHSPHYVYPVTRVPGVVTIHDLIHLHLPGGRGALRRLYARVMISRAIRDSEAILTVSKATAAAISNSWPEATTRIHVTPNGVDERFFRIQRTVNERAPFLLVIGNDKPHKNLDRLVAAWQRLATDAAALVFIGSSPERFRSVPGVELRGRVAEDELAILLGSTRGLVFPSLEEGFGLPLLEAMAAGVPVAASWIAPVREIAGDSVVMFDPKEVESIASGLQQLLAPDEHGMSWRTAAARERAAKFRWDEAARRTVEIYQRVAGTK